MTGLQSSDPKQPPSIQGCLEACGRCRSLVELVTSEQATVATRAYKVIGPHLRHCLDHFVCLLRGLDSSVVDYDARDRDERMELDPQHFLTQLDSVVQQLQAIDPATMGRSLTLRQEAAPGGRSPSVHSNIERELVFLSGHTIHHLATMSLLARDEGVNVPADLAMAFSTATYLAGKSGTAPDRTGAGK